MSRFRRTVAAGARNALSENISGSGPLEFERLLGPLDTVSDAPPILAELARLPSEFIAPGELGESIKTVANFLAGVRRLGLARTLALIAERSVGQGEDQFGATIQEFFGALLSVNSIRPITVATLNYDGLTHAGTLDIGSIADIHLLHLHGSLAWVRDAAARTSWKVNIGDLRNLCYWDRLAEGEALVDPLVILTDRKEEQVTRHPFDLAYRIFRERLSRSTHWIIAGYGFRDRPVNVALKLGPFSPMSSSALSTGFASLLMSSVRPRSRAIGHLGT